MAPIKSPLFKPRKDGRNRVLARTRNLLPRRPVRVIFGVGAFLLLCFTLTNLLSFEPNGSRLNYFPKPLRPELYPVADTFRLPYGRPSKLPKIQHEPVAETAQAKKIRESRLLEVKETFIHAWNGYKTEAWGKDELRPVMGGYKSPFCGWAATLVDSLDTLVIMGLYDEFEEALKELPAIDFIGTEDCQINLFETTIRHLGGLLSAFDLTEGKRPILLEKAVELAEILFTAFDTPNRMPSPHYVWSATRPDAFDHRPPQSVVVAVLGSLSLEFTRLSQITGNDKYYDGIQRVMNELEKWQSKTQLPGMWPAMVNGNHVNESIALGSAIQGSNELFTLGALADSTYEYLPKQYILLGGLAKQYRSMYETFVEVAKKHLFFRPMTIGDHDILIAGSVNKGPVGEPVLNPNLEHLSCFTGGMLAIAGKIFRRPEDVEDGRRLADGCVWAYRNTISGIMPETFTAVPCPSRKECKWDQEAWFKAIDSKAPPDTIQERIKIQQLSPGFSYVQDKRYLLRPEAIESVFIMWRITNDQYWADAGWDMFKAIQAHTTTALAHSAIANVLSASPAKVDEMESFWLAETLKYFFLLFSTPDVISLDEYVLNTEAHPLRRPKH